MDPGLKNNIWATLFLKEKHKCSQGYAVIPNLRFLEMQVLRAWWISAKSVDSDIKGHQQSKSPAKTVMYIV